MHAKSSTYRGPYCRWQLALFILCNFSCSCTIPVRIMLIFSFFNVHARYKSCEHFVFDDRHRCFLVLVFAAQLSDYMILQIFRFELPGFFSSFRLIFKHSLIASTHWAHSVSDSASKLHSRSGVNTAKHRFDRASGTLSRSFLVARPRSTLVISFSRINLLSAH